jgi:hypothetical protein
MEISTFDDLLLAARQQALPQRLLMVFADAELPDDATAEQCRNFESGAGGALAPLMSVDKDPVELASFAALAEESLAHGGGWDLVFVGSLGGNSGRPPTSMQADMALDHMIEAVKSGRFGNLIAFDRRGEAVSLRP